MGRTARNVRLKAEGEELVGRAPMSEAFVAGGLHWNPAGLSQIRKHEISAIYLKGLTDTWYGSIGHVHPLKSGGKLRVKGRRRT